MNDFKLYSKEFRKVKIFEKFLMSHFPEILIQNSTRFFSFSSWKEISRNFKHQFQTKIVEEIFDRFQHKILL